MKTSTTKTVGDDQDIVTLEELALSLITGGGNKTAPKPAGFDPKTAMSGEQGPDGKEMSCEQAFKAHCSSQCVPALYEDWKRLKALESKKK